MKLIKLLILLSTVSVMNSCSGNKNGNSQGDEDGYKTGGVNTAADSINHAPRVDTISTPGSGENPAATDHDSLKKM